MSIDGEDRRIDEKGRVTIPKDVRRSLDLESGETVRVTVEEGRVVIRPRVSRDERIETMKGAITAERKREDAPPMSPEDLKTDWTSDLPGGR